MIVVVTDYAWDSLEPEKQILRDAGAVMSVCETGELDELRRTVASAAGILTCWKAVPGDVIDLATECVVIGRYGIGVDNIDVDRATELGIVVTNVPAYCLDEVSDHAMALLLAAVRKVAFYDRNVRVGIWDNQIGPPIPRLRGKILGIIGMGKIGRTLAPKALGFGLRVVGFDAYIDDGAIREAGVEPLSLDELLRTSDFVSLHCPLTEETHHLLGEKEFGLMKSSAFLVNASRGGLVDTKALCEALDSGRIAGAALDVLPDEPPSKDDPILSNERAVLTPHAAFQSVESVLDLQETAATQVAKVLQGERPEYVINPVVLESSNLRAKSLR
jgi:D-3-phosphoglycerate dehydrogenase